MRLTSACNHAISEISSQERSASRRVGSRRRRRIVARECCSQLQRCSPHLFCCDAHNLRSGHGALKSSLAVGATFAQRDRHGESLALAQHVTAYLRTMRGSPVTYVILTRWCDSSDSYSIRALGPWPGSNSSPTAAVSTLQSQMTLPKQGIGLASQGLR